MALKEHRGRMLKVVLKDSTLDVIDSTTPEKNTSLYKPKESKDDNIANLISEEDLYSEYDDKGNKIKEYVPHKEEVKSPVGAIILTFILIICIFILLRYIITLI